MFQFLNFNALVQENFSDLLVRFGFEEVYTDAKQINGESSEVTFRNDKLILNFYINTQDMDDVQVQASLQEVLASDPILQNVVFPVRWLVTQIDNEYFREWNDKRVQVSKENNIPLEVVRFQIVHLRKMMEDNLITMISKGTIDNALKDKMSQGLEEQRNFDRAFREASQLDYNDPIYQKFIKNDQSWINDILLRMKNEGRL